MACCSDHWEQKTAKGCGELFRNLGEWGRRGRRGRKTQCTREGQSRETTKSEGWCIKKGSVSAVLPNQLFSS